MMSILIILLIICMFYFMFNYIAHIFETIFFERKSYDWVTFRSFIKVYQKYKEKYNFDDSKYPRRIRLRVNCYTVAQLDLKLVEFSDYCMIFYPLSYLIYCIWITKETLFIPKRIKGLWKKDKGEKNENRKYE